MGFRLGTMPWDERTIEALEQLLGAYEHYIFVNEESMMLGELEEHENKYEELKNYIAERKLAHSFL